MGFQLKFVMGLGLNSLSFQLDGKMQLGVGVRGPYLELITKSSYPHFLQLTTKLLLILEI